MLAGECASVPVMNAKADCPPSFACRKGGSFSGAKGPVYVAPDTKFRDLASKPLGLQSPVRPCRAFFLLFVGRFWRYKRVRDDPNLLVACVSGDVRDPCRVRS
mgnify:CR=1 FL=1